MSEVVGLVADINSKTGSGKRGPWELRNVKVELTDGSVQWLSLGFGIKDKQPNPLFQLSKGAFGAFEYTEEQSKDGKYTNKIVSTFQPREAPKPVVEAPQAVKAGTSVYHERDDRIGYQNSRTAAIETVKALLEHNAVPLSKTAGGTGVQARYEEIIELVNKLTVRYSNDLKTFRLFDSVVDDGDSTEPDEGLPDVGEGTPAAESTADPDAP